MSTGNNGQLHNTNRENVYKDLGVEGVVRGIEGIHLADRCVLTKLE
jgi:hypothetical protein